MGDDTFEFACVGTELEEVFATPEKKTKRAKTKADKFWSDRFFSGANRDELHRFVVMERPGRPLFVFCTYQSYKTLAVADGADSLRFGLAILDEAHCTAVTRGAAKNAFSMPLRDAEEILDDEGGPKKRSPTLDRRVFLTATRRAAMRDNIALYGNLAYSRSFASVVRLGIICDLRLKLCFVCRSAVQQRIENACRTIGVAVPHDISSYELIVACLLAAHQTILFTGRSMLAFTRLVADARQLAGGDSKEPEWLGALRRSLGIECGYVHSDSSGEEMEYALDALTQRPKTLFANVNKLSTGFDCPPLGAVLFMHGRHSLTSIIQSMCRALRAHGDKSVGYAVLPVLVNDMHDVKTGAAFARSDSIGEFADIINASRLLKTTEGEIFEKSRKSRKKKSAAQLPDETDTNESAAEVHEKGVEQSQVVRENAAVLSASSSNLASATDAAVDEEDVAVDEEALATSALISDLNVAEVALAEEEAEDEERKGGEDVNESDTRREASLESTGKQRANKLQYANSLVFNDAMLAIATQAMRGAPSEMKDETASDNGTNDAAWFDSVTITDDGALDDTRSTTQTLAAAFMLRVNAFRSRRPHGDNASLIEQLPEYTKYISKFKKDLLKLEYKDKHWADFESKWRARYKNGKLSAMDIAILKAVEFPFIIATDKYLQQMEQYHIRSLKRAERPKPPAGMLPGHWRSDGGLRREMNAVIRLVTKKKKGKSPLKEREERKLQAYIDAGYLSAALEFLVKGDGNDSDLT